MTLPLAVPTNDLAVRHASGLTTRLLIHLARRAHARSPFHTGDGLARTTQPDAYARWRTESLRRQLESHFDPRELRDKNVLDFGCGGGELSCDLVTRWRCRTVTGVDLSEASIRRALIARARLPREQRDALRFIRPPVDAAIDLPDQSMDRICCFDVVEHIPDIAAATAEWRRVLRPGGQVWIWWSPWRGPYGHHLESLLPLPWVHLVFPPHKLFRACAEIYDHPAFVSRVWDTDPVTGQKRPNKWRNATAFEPFLNRLTRRAFESAARAAGLSIAARKTHGFSGGGGTTTHGCPTPSWRGERIDPCKIESFTDPATVTRTARVRSALARATRCLTVIPGLGECFVSFYTYRLVRPMDQSTIPLKTAHPKGT